MALSRDRQKYSAAFIPQGESPPQDLNSCTEKLKIGEILGQEAKDDAISSFERQLNELTQKIAELERRLSVLERSSGPRQTNPPSRLTGQLPQPAKIMKRRSYLERMVDAARREHEREGT